LFIADSDAGVVKAVIRPAGVRTKFTAVPREWTKFGGIIIITTTTIIIIIIIINDNVYGAVLMIMVTARVHPVHLMNAD